MIPMTYTVDVCEPIKKTYLDTIFATEDDQAHNFEILLKHGNNLLDPGDGAKVKAYFIRYSDNVTVKVDGSVNRNIVNLILTKGCYQKPGQFALVIKVIRSSGAPYTVFYGEGTVFASRTEAILDEEHVIPSLDDLLAQIDAMEEATQAVNTAVSNANSATSKANTATSKANTATTNANNAAAKINGMTVSAVNADNAAAEITEVNGVKHIKFYLPRGAQGPQGPAGSGGGGTAEAVPWLKGTTADITPTQVAQALLNDQDVMISHTDPNFGTLVFTNFLIAESMGIVLSSGVFALEGSVAVCQLAGMPSYDQWGCTINELAKYSDIPDIPTHLPNPSSLTIKDSTGATLATYNGSSSKTVTLPATAGEQGKTPVKGVDYWTDADQESMVQQVIAALGTPVFGWVDDANTIILNGNLTSDTYTIMYEDANGNQIYIGTLSGEATSFINRLRESTDLNGGIYNGKGWKENVRISVSSGSTEVAGEDCMLTGFIPAKVGDIVRFKNVVMPDGAGGYQANAYGFDENKVGNGSNMSLNSSDGTSLNVVAEDGNVVQFTVNKYFFNSNENGSGYIRINAKQFTNSSIITINQEIV
ncbi:MAG: hypothetical protein J6V25_01860 [Oscillospiraceae bacterium]|nr:hypothetical protein [Oscillospiraceae bacterium]